MHIHLNKEETIKISEPKTTVLDPVTREKISKGTTSVRFIGYKGNSSYGGVWVLTKNLNKLVQIVKCIKEEASFEEKYKHQKGFNVSKFSPSGVDEDNCIKCVVCNNNMNFGNYSLSISEDYSYMGNHVRIHTECIERLGDILDLDNYKEEIVSEKITEEGI